MSTIVCPKCAGEAFLAEEELVQVLENTDPLKAIVKAHFTCKACASTFTRLLTEELNAKKKDGLMGTPSASSGTVSTDEAAEGLRFF